MAELTKRRREPSPEKDEGFFLTTMQMADRAR